MEENKIINVDCENCEHGCVGILNDKCVFKDQDYDFIRLKTSLLTKEYNKFKKLVSVLPFFVDVRLYEGEIVEKPVKEYYVSSGCKVQIFKDLNSSQYKYVIKIPEMNIDLNEIIKIKKDYDEFKDSLKTNNEYIRKWFDGYGILEYLMQDPNILEININPPGYKTPIKIVHAGFDECTSNIYPSDDFLNMISTRLKLITGRPLNKAQPQLDGELMIGNSKVRIAAVTKPFSVNGLGYSIRKHREDPWTVSLFLKNKMIDPWFSGLMNLAITHGRTFLTAGPRGSGKTSLMSALLLEILPKYRMITIEDTQELPINSYKRLGYDILPLKVRSALLKEGMEIPYDIGLRTSLRLGDSCLVIGEIRSTEAKVLYEAMRVGAMSNVVCGTIHGDSPYGVYDRVVNDLGVPKGSFKVTDLIITVNQIKSSSGVSRKRRVLKVTEVLKDWTDEPKFQDLLVYDKRKDMLVPTSELLNGKSVLLKDILSKTQGYLDYDDMIEDIKLRAWAKQTHVELCDENELEASYISKINVLFANLYESIDPLSSKAKLAFFKKEFRSRLVDYFKLDRDYRKNRQGREVITNNVGLKEKDLVKKDSYQEVVVEGKPNFFRVMGKALKNTFKSYVNKK